MPAPAPALREARRRDLVDACRTIFDARGVADAPVEEIAQAVGIARGLIYREFTAKEELVVLTVAGYLAELAVEMEAAAGAAGELPEAQVAALVSVYTGFCRRYPAFLDGQIGLMRRPAGELFALVSPQTWHELGDAMAGCLGPVADVIRRGCEHGRFRVGDPELAANLVWTQMLGAMHLGRLGVGVRRTEDGEAALLEIRQDDLVAACVASALATLGTTSARS
ncbi:MAG: transcriptional regulator, TetR family [Solirubrobacterales bacterium]|nr:transcriptional regulator, TetR family [Solirubrobacterales bacterium]